MASHLRLGAAALATLASLLVPDVARADLWRDVTGEALGTETVEWSNKTDLADVDGDGDVDLLFANGSAYNEPGQRQLNGVWLNDGNASFTDVSEEVLGDEGDFTRVIKGRDVTGDGIVDLLVGNTYETQSRLFVGLGGGKFEERTDLLPQMNASVGDLEVGDVDGDGDLDIVLADWGLDPIDGELQDPFVAEGAPPLVWLNELEVGEDGTIKGGGFVDATEDVVDGVPTAWAWEIELIDVDGDFDLDIMASSKVGAGSNLYLNEGGQFRSSDELPQFTNNYDFEPMFITMPGADEPSLAVVTINDGVQVSHKFDLRERIFVADADGAFRDATADIWPDEDNKGEDDNMVVVLDFDSDGDPDFLIGALGENPDRLHVNDLEDEGKFTLDDNAGLTTGLTNTPRNPGDRACGPQRGRQARRGPEPGRARRSRAGLPRRRDRSRYRGADRSRHADPGRRGRGRRRACARARQQEPEPPARLEGRRPRGHDRRRVVDSSDDLDGRDGLARRRVATRGRRVPGVCRGRGRQRDVH